MSHTEGVMLPLNEVTIAVAEIAILDVGPVQEIPLVRGATPQRIYPCVAIERTIRSRHENAVGAIRAAAGVPVLLYGIKIDVVFGVHVVGEADLFFVVHAVRLQGLGARARQCRQQKAGKYRNDRDHDQEFDKCERSTRARNNGFHMKSGAGFVSIVGAKQRVSKAISTASSSLRSLRASRRT